MRDFWQSQASAREKRRVNGASGGKLNRYLRLVDGAKLLHELLGAGNDVVATRLEELAGVKALALLILASLDVLAGGLSKDQLALGVDVIPLLLSDCVCWGCWL